jgi:hypothetical protein
LRALSVLNISPTSRNLSIPTSLPHTRSTFITPLLQLY